MNLLLALLLSPAVIISAQSRYRKSTNPNDEPFLPIHPEYPYNPKLMKRGLEQQQAQQLPIQQQQSIAQYTPELYAPKIDGREAYAASYNPSSYYAGTAYDPYLKSTGTTTSSASSAYYQPNYATAYPASPYGSSSLLNSYGSPYGSPSPGYAASPSTPGFGAAPYAAGAYPNYYYQQPPYPFYPGYYGQPPYGPPPPPGYPSKHRDDEDEDEEEDRHREKSKKSGHRKNKLRHSERDSGNYVDGANYIISSAKDLDGESSTHRTPSQYNQLEHDSDVRPRAPPKATYRLVSVSGQQPESAPAGYIKVHQLEQLMRQALSRLLAQNAAQQASLAQLQQEGKEAQQQYISLPSTIAKTGLSYVVNPTILNRATPGQYNPSQLILTGNNKPSYGGGEQSSGPAEYGDYDQADSVTARSHPPSTLEPARNYSYSTYRPTPQTNLEDVNFGSKQKSKS